MRNPGRIVGLLYGIASVPGFFALLYVPGKVFVPGDPAATAHSIAAHSVLFRCGIVADLVSQALFLVVAVALYQLLRRVDARHALLMLVLIAVSIPIAFVTELNSIAALTLARGEGVVSQFGDAQRIALMRLFLDLRRAGFDIAGIFWGLWLFPLGWLVYRSRFIPRTLGILLMIGCCAYLANSVTSLALPQYQDAVSRWMSPLQLVEMLFMLWLLMMGARPASNKVAYPSRLDAHG